MFLIVEILIKSISQLFLFTIYPIVWNNIFLIYTNFKSSYTVYGYLLYSFIYSAYSLLRRVFNRSRESEFFIFCGIKPKNFLSSGVLSFGKLFHASHAFDGSFSWNRPNALCIILAYPSRDLGLSHL